MKRVLRIALPIALIFSKTLFCQYTESMDRAVYEMNELHRPACGSADGGFAAIGTSMLGWGFALFIGIALVTGLVCTSTGNNNNNNND